MKRERSRNWGIREYKEAIVEDDKETTEIKKLMEIILDEEEVAINAIPLAVKSLSIIDWKIHKEGRKSYYQIIRTDGKSQMYMIFSHMLKVDREDLETLYKLVKAKYESTRPWKTWICYYGVKQLMKQECGLESILLRGEEAFK
ncbi:hypothetical protein Tco_0312084 [Tanacetum coccineum]